MSSNNKKLEKLFTLTQECCSHLSALGKNGLAAKLLLTVNEARKSFGAVPTSTATASTPSRPLIDIATGKEVKMRSQQERVESLKREIDRLSERNWVGHTLMLYEFAHPYRTRGQVHLGSLCNQELGGCRGALTLLPRAGEMAAIYLQKIVNFGEPRLPEIGVQYLVMGDGEVVEDRDGEVLRGLIR